LCPWRSFRSLAHSIAHEREQSFEIDAEGAGEQKNESMPCIKVSYKSISFRNAEAVKAMVDIAGDRRNHRQDSGASLLCEDLGHQRERSQGASRWLRWRF
jgi:hypothetical protein